MAITTRTQFVQNIAKGLGFISPVQASGNTFTAGAAASGFFGLQIRANFIGTSYPSTLVNYNLPPSAPSELLVMHHSSAMNSTTVTMHALAWLYKVGTLNLATTGDQFTHDTATFPINRTVLGASSTPINLVPLVQITTAAATTAPVFRLRTVGGAAGYTNQDGTSVVGTKTMTMPSATVAVNSSYIFRLEEGDCAVRDISNIEVTTAGTAGAATIWGAEIISWAPTKGSATPFAHDHLFGGLSPLNMKPGAATSGTATAVLGTLTYVSNASSIGGYFLGALNS